MSSNLADFRELLRPKKLLLDPGVELPLSRQLLVIVTQSVVA